jgi:hypothetical protein
MGRPGLLVEARPAKASSIEARQHSGVDTRVEYTHALEGTERQGKEFKTGQARFAIIAVAASNKHAKRRRLKGGPNTRMRLLESTSVHKNVKPDIKAAVEGRFRWIWSWVW